MKTPEEYDKVMRETGLERYGQLSYKERNWKIRSIFLKYNHPNAKVLELASGYHQLCDFVIRTEKVKSYTLTDFSTYVNEEARKFQFYPPIVDVQTLDCEDSSTYKIFKKYDTFICVSMEHLENDLLMVSKMPKNSSIYLGSPNFNSAGHVRYFKHLDDFIARYSELIDIKYKAVIKVGVGKNKKYVLWGIKK